MLCISTPTTFAVPTRRSCGRALPMERERTLAPKSWKIRLFQPDELGAFGTLADISLSSPEASEFSAEDYQRIASLQGGILLVCEWDAHICGFVAGRQAAGEAEILNFAVHPRF